MTGSLNARRKPGRGEGHGNGILASLQVQRAAEALAEAPVVRERIASVAVRMHRWDGGAARLPLVAPAALALTRGEWRARG